MSIFPLNVDTMSSGSSFVKHMKNIQLFSCIPLSLDVRTFSHVSKPFFLLSLVVCVVNLVHQWTPQLSMQWYTNGQLSAILTVLEKITHSAVPILFSVTTLISRFKFEKTTSKFLFILKALGLWNYKMFPSCKLALFMFAIGVVGLLVRNVISVWFGAGGTMTVIDDTLWALHYFYLFSWAFMFIYTVRTVKTCFRKIAEMTVEDNGNLKSYFHTYNRLVDIAAEMNDFYDLPVSCVLLLLLLAFIDYTSIAMAEMTKMTLVDRLYMYLWIIILVTLLICLLGTCQSASEQADSSNDALLKYLVHHKNTINRDNPLLIIHLCARKRLVFKACKSFTINYNLGISMIAAYVTYIIVLYQMEHSTRSPLITSKNVTN